jgi:hypothetical protein
VVALPVCLFVEAERLLAVRLVGNDSVGASLFQRLAQLCAVVGSVADEPLGRVGSTDQARGRRAVVRLTSGQQDGKKTALSICDCVDFRVAPAARAANRLFLLPPFPPEAERCALTCVLSNIWVSPDRPRAASSRNSRSHTPRSAQRTNRL